MFFYYLQGPDPGRWSCFCNLHISAERERKVILQTNVISLNHQKAASPRSQRPVLSSMPNICTHIVLLHTSRSPSTVVDPTIPTLKQQKDRDVAKIGLGKDLSGPSPTMGNGQKICTPTTPLHPTPPPPFQTRTAGSRV
jgi:hypothetical protein